MENKYVGNLFNGKEVWIDTNIHYEIVRLVQSRNFVGAIVLVRQSTGLGLKEAKYVVDNLYR